MSKRTAIVLGVVVGLSAGYDSWRGYHQTRSVASGTAAILLGVCVLALFVWLYYRRPDSN